MELFRYIAKNGSVSIVHTQYHPDRFETEWSLRVDGNPYGYYRREQDARRVGTLLKRKLIENGCEIIVSGSNEKWTNDYGMRYRVSRGW